MKSKDQKNYQISQKSKELLSSSLSEIESKFSLDQHQEEYSLKDEEEVFDEYKEAYKESLNFQVPNIKLLGNQIYTTARLMNVAEQGGFLVKEMNVEMLEGLRNILSEEQYVVAVGDYAAKDVSIGDKIKIRFTDFIKPTATMPGQQRQEEMQIETEVINDVQYICCSVSNIKHIYNDSNILNK